MRKMKFPPTAKIKIFVILISLLFVLTMLMINSKHGAVVVQAAGGADIYASSCARCHGTDGRARTAKGRQTGATNFTSAKWQLSDAKGIRTITNGKGKMPSFKGALSAEEIRAVWNFVRGFKQ